MDITITNPLNRPMVEDSEKAEEEESEEFDLGEEIDELMDTSLRLSRLEKAALFLLIGAPIAIIAKIADDFRNCNVAGISI